jgi:hypothetical protein
MTSVCRGPRVASQSRIAGTNPAQENRRGRFRCISRSPLLVRRLSVVKGRTTQKFGGGRRPRATPSQTVWDQQLIVQRYIEA